MVFANGRLHLRGRDGIRCVPRIAVVRGAGTCAVTASCNFFFSIRFAFSCANGHTGYRYVQKVLYIKSRHAISFINRFGFVCRSAPLPPLAGLAILCLFKPLPPISHNNI